MPINYKNYPRNWKTEIRPAILSRDNNRCKFCGVNNYEIGYWVNDVFVNPVYLRYGYRNLSYKAAKEDLFHIRPKYNFKLIIIVLTIAHLDHDINNNDHKNLAALCQRCHNGHDVGQRKANRKANRGVYQFFL